jgi:hypothetical protein
MLSTLRKVSFLNLKQNAQEHFLVVAVRAVMNFSVFINYTVYHTVKKGEEEQ